MAAQAEPTHPNYPDLTRAQGDLCARVDNLTRALQHVTWQYEQASDNARAAARNGDRSTARSWDNEANRLCDEIEQISKRLAQARREYEHARARS